MTTERRIPALDGFRGVMTIAVVLSHYFAEIRGGLSHAGVGFLAVDAFFVLSGLLVGRLILDKQEARNFLRVFYTRRVCRTFPTYFLVVTLTLALSVMVHLPTSAAVPAWSYLTFSNNLFMAAHNAVGAESLGPTWTMAVEEQFYLVVPALLILTPRRHLVPVLGGIILAAIVWRFVLAFTGHQAMELLVLLPTRADDLAIGVMCALLLTSSVDWTALVFRAAPVVLLVVVFVLRFFIGGDMLPLAGHPLICLAFAFFLMSVVAGAPEARRFEGRVLRFFGDTSYATYMVHMPVLCVAHWLIRAAEPSLNQASGVAVTFACLPITLAISYGLTRWVEAPMSALGRRSRWDLTSGPKTSRGGRALGLPSAT